MDISSKVIGIDGKRVEPKQDTPWQQPKIVALLELLLEKARAGQIDAIAVNFMTPEPDGEHLYQSCWEGPRITLLGSVARMLYALNRELDGNDRGYVGR